VTTRLAMLGPLMLAVQILSFAQAAAQPAWPITITVIGPEARRRDVEEAVNSLWQTRSGARALSWSTRDEAPQPEAPAASRPDMAGDIWVDLTDPERARIILSGGAEGTVVRSVDAATSDGNDGWPATCEMVAQIVAGTARALDDSRSVSRVASAAPTAASPEPSVGIRRPASPPGTRDAPANDRYGLALVAGEHTSPYELGEPHDEHNWLGASVSLAARRETRNSLFEVRLTAERSMRSIDQLDLRTQYYSAAIGASHAFTSASGEFSASVGVELGALLLRQATSPGDLNLAGSAASLVGAFALGGGETTWSAGVLSGLLGQVTWRVRPPFFINLMGGVPVVVMNVNMEYPDNGHAHWRQSFYFRMMGGLGVYL